MDEKLEEAVDTPSTVELERLVVEGGGGGGEGTMVWLVPVKAPENPVLELVGTLKTDELDATGWVE